MNINFGGPIDGNPPPPPAPPPPPPPKPSIQSSMVIDSYQPQQPDTIPHRTSDGGVDYYASASAVVQ